MSFQRSKRSLAGYKGHYNVSVKAFHALCALQPYRTKDSIEKSYSKLQERVDALLAAVDRTNSVLEEAETMEAEKVDVESETQELLAYHEKVLTELNEIEKLFVDFQVSYESRNDGRNTRFQDGRSSATSLPTSSPTTRPSVRLTALDPPGWSGIKADFYTWKKKFIHIMHEANISSELTQLCYLQKQKTLPQEYQIFISDCSSINEVWSRLGERIPKETIKFEIISEFRKLRPLPSRCTPIMLRDFTNEISLFCRRMTDLEFREENYSCIVMQDIYERLNLETTRRYRGKIALQRELGHDVEENLESLCVFLRSEATTLELSTGDHASSSRWPLKKFNTLNIDDENADRASAEKTMCPLGCNQVHRLIDCDAYMKMTPEDRNEFLRSVSRCFCCLSENHMEDFTTGLYAGGLRKNH